jgi:hypothetical protein
MNFSTILHFCSSFLNTVQKKSQNETATPHDKSPGFLSMESFLYCRLSTKILTYPILFIYLFIIKKTTEKLLPSEVRGCRTNYWRATAVASVSTVLKLCHIHKIVHNCLILLIHIVNRIIHVSIDLSRIRIASGITSNH